MSIAVGLLVRLLGLFGVSLSPFIAGAIVTGGIALAIGGAGLHLYNAGWRSADAQWQAKALQSQIDALTADRDAARAAQDDAEQRVTEIGKNAEKAKQETDAYVEQLKGKFKTACAIDDDDLRGLRTRPGKAGGAASGAPAAARWLDDARRRAVGH